MDYSGSGTVTVFSIASLLSFLSITNEVDGGLVISLEESDASLPFNALVPITNVTTNERRRVDLVLGRSYHLHCEDKEGGTRQDSLTAVWYSGDVEVPAGSISSSDRASPMVYSYLEENRRTLVLTNFTGGNVGLYTCRERDSSNTDGAGVVLGSGNPTVVTGAQNKVLKFGHQQDNSRPSLVAFVSGSPYPLTSSIVWRFNNGTLPREVVVNGNELLLPSNIREEMKGRYSCHVTTSMGAASADIYVTLIYAPIVSVAPSGPLAVKINSSITISCEDRDGDPPPTFMWSHNDTGVMGDRVTKLDTSTAGSHSSSVTITNFQPTDSGDYECIASNIAGSSRQTLSVYIFQLSPPAPPTSISVTSISACSVLIEWAWTSITSTNRDDNNVASPDYIVFELNRIIDESDWTEIAHLDTTQNSLVVRIPPTGLNTQFQLRAKYVSHSHGAGPYYTTDVYTAYSEATLPVLLPPSTQTLSSSAIQVSWNLPAQECFNVTSFTISCKPIEVDNNTVAQADRNSNVNTIDNSVVTMGIVPDLEPDTSYNCSVSGHLRDSLTGELAIQVTAYARQLTTTYPEFDIFELYLKGITDCKEWIKDSTMDKREDIAIVVAVAIEGACNCGFTENSIKMRELRCSPSLPGVVVFRSELHDTPQANIPLLVSLLRGWVSEEPSFLLQSQNLMVQVNSSCVSSGDSEVNCSPASEDSQTATIFSTYTVVGIAVGVAVILVVGLTITILIIALMVSRHRKTAKLNLSSDECKKTATAIPSASNPTATPSLQADVTKSSHDQSEGYPYYEEVDIEGEPQYESLDDYDRLDRIPGSTSGVNVGKIPVPCVLQADCPVYEPLDNSASQT